MDTEAAFHFRVDPKTRRLLDRLREERHFNISSWALGAPTKGAPRAVPRGVPGRNTRRDAGTADARTTAAAHRRLETQEPRQRKRQGGLGGAALAGPKVAQLPKELSGIQITATAASGKSWTGPIEKVVSRSEDLVVVRYSQSEAD